MSLTLILVGIGAAVMLGLGGFLGFKIGGATAPALSIPWWAWIIGAVIILRLIGGRD